MKNKMILAAAWVCSAITVLAGIYMAVTGTNAGISVIFMVFALIFHGIYR